MNVTTVLPQATSNGGTNSNDTSGLPSSQSLDTMFLQLLVAQLQNQDPTSPMDPTQFVSQLAQFSELSQVTQINQLLEQVVSGSSSTTGKSQAPAAVPNTAGPEGQGSEKPASPLFSPGISSVENALSNFMSHPQSAASPLFQHQIQGVF
ncbi:MAG TPA: flagellar hook capping FlgD N-terminal domain-containing protein [Silvibacterium sp.]|nr:flagellar hook capping FlgD N-terminal domain-containing protein [Silvibacterium sp.]